MNVMQTGGIAMTAPGDQLRVFYDGACPSCVKDRRLYERLAGRTGESVEWVDITGRDEELEERGIDPPSSTLPARFRPEIGTHGMRIQ